MNKRSKHSRTMSGLVSSETCCKVVYIRFRNKVHSMKLYRFVHPIIVKQQMNINIQEIMYMKFIALRNVETGRLVRLKPHFMFQDFNFLDPERLKTGVMYDLYVRDYGCITHEMLDEQSLKLLTTKFNGLKNVHGHITYGELDSIATEKQEMVKKHISSQMDSFLDKLSMSNRHRVETNGFGHNVQKFILEAENAIGNVALLIMKAMDQSGNKKISLQEWLCHWAKMTLFISDQGARPKETMGRIASRESLYQMDVCQT